MLLFRTVHGSHLYGTAHANSDVDTFEVHANRPGRRKARYAKQSIKGSDDTLKTDLSTFMLYAAKGVPQYLEAMYSQKSDVDMLGWEFRHRFVPNLYEAMHTYRRTITALYEDGVETGSDKHKRHAWRLYMNMYYVERGLYFNPTLVAGTLEFINQRLDRNPLDE